MEIFKIVEKINEFAGKFDELTEETAKSISDLVIEKVGVLKIKITHDNFHDISKYKNMRLDFQEGRIEPHVVLDGISKSSDIVPGFKMILSTFRNTANYAIPVVRRCNGVIIHVGEYIDSESSKKSVKCKVMAMSSNDFTTKVDKRRIADHLNEGLYDLYMVNDGTTLNIYYDENYLHYTIEENPDDLDDVKKVYHKGRWMYATKNAVDAKDMPWRGYTYHEVLEDVLKKYPEFSLDKLDKKKSYTIGFTHPAYHPFNQPAEWRTGSTGSTDNTATFHKEAWFIQSTNVESGESLHDEDIGLPLQKKHDIKEFITDDSDPGACLQNILNRAHNSMEEFTRGVRMNIISENYKPPPTFLGIFLRSRDENITKQFSDVLIESSLWVAIRQAIYQKPYTPNKELREKQEYNFKNFTYVILDAYLNIHKNKEFITLFPQFRHYYDKLDEATNTVSEMIFQEMQKGGKKKEIAANENHLWMYTKFLPLVQNNFKVNDNKSRSFHVQGGPGGRGGGGGPGGRGGGDRGGRGGSDRGRGRGRGGIGSGIGSGDAGISSLSININDKKIIKTLITHPKYTDLYFQGLYDTENRDVSE